MEEEINPQNEIPPTIPEVEKVIETKTEPATFPRDEQPKGSIGLNVIIYSFYNLILYSPVLLVIFFSTLSVDMYLAISIVMSLILGFLTYKLISNISKNERHWIIAAGVTPLLYLTIAVYYAITVYNFIIERTSSISAQGSGLGADIMDKAAMMSSIPQPMNILLYSYAAFQIPFLIAVIFKENKKLTNLVFYLLNLILLGFSILIGKALANGTIAATAGLSFG